MRKPLLVMFLGVPGSGKSFFARQLAKKIDAVRLNGDSMRLAIFGSLEEIEKVYYSENRQRVNSYVFNAIDYTVEEILSHGDDVVYDAHHNKRSIREELERLAVKCGAIPVLVWIKTPHNVALIRGQTREATRDQRQLSEEKMRESMTRHAASMDEPGLNENAIEISGELPFEKQYDIFEQKVREIRREQAE